MAYTLHFGQVTRFIPDLIAGAGVSLVLAALAFCGGMVLGLLGAFAITYGGGFSRRLSRAYVVFFTNTPQLVQIFFLFFVLPGAEIVLSPFSAVLLGMTLNAGAYLTEIQRAGFGSVPPGELDAAEGTWHAAMAERPLCRAAARDPDIICTTVQPLHSDGSRLVHGCNFRCGRTDRTGDQRNAETFRSVEIFSITAGLYIIITFLATLALAVAGRLMFRVRLRVV